MSSKTLKAGIQRKHATAVSSLSLPEAAVVAWNRIPYECWSTAYGFRVHWTVELRFIGHAVRTFRKTHAVRYGAGSEASVPERRLWSPATLQTFHIFYASTLDTILPSSCVLMHIFSLSTSACFIVKTHVAKFFFLWFCVVGMGLAKPGMQGEWKKAEKEWVLDACHTFR